MTLLRIGGRYINLDLVQYVEEDVGSGIRLFFSGAAGEDSMLHLGGEEAAGLKQWLRLNSTEARPLPLDWHHTEQVL